MSLFWQSSSHLSLSIQHAAAEIAVCADAAPFGCYYCCLCYHHASPCVLCCYPTNVHKFICKCLRHCLPLFVCAYVFIKHRTVNRNLTRPRFPECDSGEKLMITAKSSLDGDTCVTNRTSSNHAKNKPNYCKYWTWTPSLPPHGLQ